MAKIEKRHRNAAKSLPAISRASVWVVENVAQAIADAEERVREEMAHVKHRNGTDMTRKILHALNELNRTISQLRDAIVDTASPALTVDSTPALTVDSTPAPTVDSTPAPTVDSTPAPDSLTGGVLNAKIEGEDLDAAKEAGQKLRAEVMRERDEARRSAEFHRDGEDDRGGHEDAFALYQVSKVNRLSPLEPLDTYLPNSITGGIGRQPGSCPYLPEIALAPGLNSRGENPSRGWTHWKVVASGDHADYRDDATHDAGVVGVYQRLPFKISGRPVLRLTWTVGD